VIPNLKKWVLVYVGEECKVIKEISWYFSNRGLEYI
jgi:hypothetical protein